MIDSGLVVPIMEMLYSLVYTIARILWFLDQILISGAIAIAWLRNEIVSNIFVPVLGNISTLTESMVGGIFVVALLVLGATYMLSVFFRLNVVEFKSAFLWWLLAGIIFGVGPGVYVQFEQFRMNVGGWFYVAASDAANNASFGSPIVGGSPQTDPATEMNPVTDVIDGSMYPMLSGVDGIDTTLAYLYADACDALRTPAVCTGFGQLPDLPYIMVEAGGESFFDPEYGPANFRNMPQEERVESIELAGMGAWRLFSGLLMALVALIEQVIQLILTISFMLGWAGMYIAILFAFFKRTEPITYAAFNNILQLFVQSIITSLMLSLIIGFIQIGGASGNALMLLGVVLVAVVLLIVLMQSALKSIISSFNALFDSFSSATGGNMTTGKAIVEGLENTASGVATAAAIKASGGSSAQALGALFDGQSLGQQAFYASRLLGGSETEAGRALEEFGAGVYARNAGDQIGGPLGGALVGALLGSQSAKQKEEQREAEEQAENEKNKRRSGNPLAGTFDSYKSGDKDSGDDGGSSGDGGSDGDDGSPGSGSPGSGGGASLSQAGTTSQALASPLAQGVNERQLAETLDRMNEDDFDEVTAGIQNALRRNPGSDFTDDRFVADVGRSLGTDNPLSQNPNDLSNYLANAQGSYAEAGIVSPAAAPVAPVIGPQLPTMNDFRDDLVNSRRTGDTADGLDGNGVNTRQLAETMDRMSEDDIDDLMGAIKQVRQDNPDMDMDSGSFRNRVGRQLSDTNPLAFDPDGLGNVLRAASSYDNATANVPAAPIDASLAGPAQQMFDSFRATPLDQRDDRIAEQFPDATAVQRNRINRGLAAMGQGDMSSVLEGMQEAIDAGIDPSSPEGLKYVRENLPYSSPIRQNREDLKSVVGAFESMIEAPDVSGAGVPNISSSNAAVSTSVVDKGDTLSGSETTVGGTAVNTQIGGHSDDDTTINIGDGRSIAGFAAESQGYVGGTSRFEGFAASRLGQSTGSDSSSEEASSIHSSEDNVVDVSESPSESGQPRRRGGRRRRPSDTVAGADLSESSQVSSADIGSQYVSDAGIPRQEDFAQAPASMQSSVGRVGGHVASQSEQPVINQESSSVVSQATPQVQQPVVGQPASPVQPSAAETGGQYIPQSASLRQGDVAQVPPPVPSASPPVGSQAAPQVQQPVVGQPASSVQPSAAETGGQYIPQSASPRQGDVAQVPPPVPSASPPVGSQAAPQVQHPVVGQPASYVQPSSTETGGQYIPQSASPRQGDIAQAPSPVQSAPPPVSSQAAPQVQQPVVGQPASYVQPSAAETGGQYIPQSTSPRMPDGAVQYRVSEQQHETVQRAVAESNSSVSSVLGQAGVGNREVQDQIVSEFRSRGNFSEATITQIRSGLEQQDMGSQLDSVLSQLVSALRNNSTSDGGSSSSGRATGYRPSDTSLGTWSDDEK